MQKEFNKQLNVHLNQWVQNSQSIGLSPTGQPFFSVGENSNIVVNLNLLSASYRNKHIVSQSVIYCNAFLSAIQPYLAQFLVQFGIRRYEFAFCFLMNGTTFEDCLLTAA